MTLLDLMDAIQVHAAAAAVDANPKFTDVAVGFAVAKGKCVRIFYGGEAAPQHFKAGKTLNSRLMAQVIVVRAHWPLADRGTNRERLMEGEMATFVKSLRTRILGDSQLGGASSDLNMTPARTEQVVIASTTYAITENRIVVDYDETAIAP